MSLYPSLEDMKVDHLARAQLAQQHGPVSIPTHVQLPAVHNSQQISYPPYPPMPTNVIGDSSTSATPRASPLYPELGEYMGLDLTPEFLAQHMPTEYQEQNVPPPTASANNAVAVPPPSAIAVPRPTSGMIAPLSGGTVGLLRAQVTHGVREVTLCKDNNGKVGLRVKDVSKGVFVALVQKNSPAAMVGLRFGDQILQINGENVAGYNVNKVHDMFKSLRGDRIVLAVRDRPFERTMTLHKDSTGHIGFGYKNGQIIFVVKDSSAARNGLLTDHHLLEVNGQNVVGLKDKDITAIIDGGGNIITITIMPSFLYEHMMKHMRSSIVKNLMDHSIPDL